FFIIISLRHSSLTLFPYTTLFRSILRGSVEEFEGLPIITLSGSPMYGWNSVMKRAFDLCIGGSTLLLALPVLALVTCLVKLTSRSEEHTSELQSRENLVCRLLLEK